MEFFSRKVESSESQGEPRKGETFIHETREHYPDIGNVRKEVVVQKETNEELDEKIYKVNEDGTEELIY